MATTKLHVGRVFSLKNYKFFPTNRGSIAKEQMGERVLIIDETAKQVKVMSKNGRPLWVSRFYLKQEISEEIDGDPKGELSKIINDLSNIANSDHELSTKIYTLIKRLRTLQENL